MKTKINILLLAAVSFMTIAAAQSTKSDLLIGTWKLQSLSPEFPLNVTDKEKIKDEKIIADDTEYFKKNSFIFTKYGELTLGKKKFTWVMNATGNKVNVSKGHKVIIVATILKLSDHELIFTRPDEGMIVKYDLKR